MEKMWTFEQIELFYCFSIKQSTEDQHNFAGANKWLLVAVDRVIHFGDRRIRTNLPSFHSMSLQSYRSEPARVFEMKAKLKETMESN